MYNASSLTPFRNAEFELFVIAIRDTFHVQAPGLARALGFADARDLIRHLPEAEKGSELLPTPGGHQTVWYVTEAGFYRAIGQRQAARIRDDEMREKVERFQHWVYHEVLVSIRKHGYYAPMRPTTLTWDEIRAEIRQSWALDLTSADLQRTLKSAGILKQTGAPKAAWRDRFWWTGSAWNVLSADASEIVGRVVSTRRALDAPRIPRQVMPVEAQLELDIPGATR